MNGPDHYREAERLLAEAHSYGDASDAVSVALQSRAQAHATLALAAATAMQAAVDGEMPGMDSDEFIEWYEAAGVKPNEAAS